MWTDSTANIWVRDENRFGDVELALFFAENLPLHEEVHQVPSRQVLHHQVEVALVLERAEELHNPRVAGLYQQVPFGFQVLRVVLREDVFFLELLDCDDFVSLSPATQVHFAIPTSSDYCN